MFEAIQYLVSSKKLEDGFGMDNVAVREITRLCDDNMGLDLKFIHNNIARVLHDILNNCYGLEINQTNDFRLLIDVLRDPQAFHELNQELMSILRYFCNKYFIYFLTFFYFKYFYLVNISYPVTRLKLFNTGYHQTSWKMNLVWIM
ncbi:hypothetical protein AAG906_011241 [Vitis piasezkii]